MPWKARARGILLEKLGVGVRAAHFPKAFSLIMTKICDFCYPIGDLAKSSIPRLFMTFAAGTVALSKMKDFC